MVYSIFRNNRLIVSVKPLDNSELSQKKQSEDVVRLNFILTNYVDVKVGDYIVKNSQFYILNKAPRVQESPKYFEYECIFEGALHHLYKTKIFLTTNKVGGVYTDYKFPLTGTAQTFLNFIVDNLNRNGGNYEVGACKVTNSATIDFNNWNALEAITTISETLGFDWYLENNVLNFDAKTFQVITPLQTGRGLGLLHLTRMRVENEDIETVVYGYGSSKNLPRDVFESNLLTENRLCFVGVGGESKLEKNIALFGRVEQVKEFDEIKPEFKGAITSVSSTNIFYDTSIDFDINNYLLPGIKAKITFLTGNLIGRTFNIDEYLHSERRVNILPVTEDDAIYPNTTIKPAIGDQYVFIDISMPEEYITAAQTRLQEATQTYLDSKAKNLELYEAELDEVFIQRNNVVLTLGDLVRIISPTFGIDNLYEIKELTQNINNEFKYTIKFGDIIPKNLLNLLKISNFNTQQNIYNVSNSQVTNNQVTNIVGDEVVWQSLD